MVLWVLVLAAWAILYQSEGLHILQVFVRVFDQVLLSCEASSTHHIPPCTLFLSLFHKFHDARMAALIFLFVKITVEGNLLEGRSEAGR